MLDRNFFQEIVDAKLLTIEQLQKARELAAEKNRSLFDVLTEENQFVTEVDLIKFFADRSGKLFIDKIYESMIDPLLLAKIPFKFLKQNSVVIILQDAKPFVLLGSPKHIDIIDDLGVLFATSLTYGFAPRAVISDAINRYYPFTAAQEAIDELKEDEEGFDLEDIKEQDIMDMTSDAPIVKLVNHIIFQSVKEDASDIHIEPFEKELRIRFRIDGIMHLKLSPPKRYHGAIISRIKIMSNMNIAEKRIPQDGRIQMRVADKSIDFRVSVLPCNFGERVVMRLLDKSRGVTELEKMPMSKRDYGIITKTTSRPNGVVLVSGPTGSGKTTTLYSLLQKLNDADSNIITVEDPVEYTMQGVNQVQVNTKTGLTFSIALRSILRQDPDIALIGEIRDGETAQIATQAALTGHLVLSTIHTNSAPATITRLIDMGIEPFLIASSLNCVIAQRLVRALCQACKEKYAPSDEVLSKVGISKESSQNVSFYKAVGCKECFNGYKGRIPVFEVMEVSDQIASLIVKRVDAIEIKKIAIAEGMTTLIQDGITKAREGKTTLEEVMSVAFAS